MQRYFIESEDWNQPFITLRHDNAKHIMKVMRMQTGDAITCLDNEGRSVLCVIRECQEKKVLAEIKSELDENPELPVKTVIAQGLAKGDKLDIVVQKGTELGVSRFCFFAAERSVVKWETKKADKKMERLRKIAKEAAEQSGRLYIPEISFYPDFSSVLETADRVVEKVLLYEETSKSHQHAGLKEVLKREPASLLAVIGPEGGISEKEAILSQQQGFTPVSLGPRILRTETAPLYLLAALSYHYEILR